MAATVRTQDERNCWWYLRSSAHTGSGSQEGEGPVCTEFKNLLVVPVHRSMLKARTYFKAVLRTAPNGVQCEAHVHRRGQQVPIERDGTSHRRRRARPTLLLCLDSIYVRKKENEKGKFYLPVF